eukprot:6206222-Pleurochrysis_carterae.AAC.1
MIATSTLPALPPSGDLRAQHIAEEGTLAFACPLAPHKHASAGARSHHAVHCNVHSTSHTQA